MAILTKLLNRNKAGQLEAQPAAPAIEAPAGPPLILLVPEASGPSASRLHAFPDASAAADYVRFWFPQRLRHGLIAFWALSAMPAEEPPNGRETVVIVRDELDDGIAYAFSFLDLDSALQAVRRETEHGLQLDRISVYWCVRADVVVVDDDVAIVPDSAPETVRPVMVRPPVPVAVAVEPVPVPAPVHIPARDARTESSQPAPTLSPVGFLLSQLADALRSPAHNASRAAFQGFGSPPGRF